MYFYLICKMNNNLKKYFILIILCFLKYQRIITRSSIRPRRQRESVSYGRVRVFSEDVNAILNNDDIKCREHLRLKSTTFRSIVCLMPEKRSGWTNEYELVVFLYWMASGCSYRLAGGFIGMSRYTVKCIVHKMLDFFCVSMRHLIRHVQPNDCEEIASKFCRRSRSNIFENAIGAIDGTHVRILCPVRKHDEYLNYKRFYSIQCQSVVDSKLMFNDVFVGFPGSVHDTRVLKNSQIYKSGNYPTQPYYLLGDSGYACRLHPLPIITPYKTPNSDQKQFNTAHSKARNVVECAFGIMKSRWRNVFNKGLELKIENCIKTIFTACVLHNICIEGEDLGPPIEEPIDANENTVDNLGVEENDSNEALEFRNSLLQRLLSN